MSEALDGARVGDCDCEGQKKVLRLTGLRTFSPRGEGPRWVCQRLWPCQNQRAVVRVGGLNQGGGLYIVGG
ncbi:hypothetical protein BDZ94DRAFT_1278180 [Collybia nuda]|uniref:Uncharacterized protein n=1 Tax=Collybia nuda TaxID=64659 RepID=A0A9P5XTE2_9AGAR|nr:hypothetical protein BDZ94DRAFT_1278180 [Collybia nuda]